jgi:hypothetical protein
MEDPLDPIAMDLEDEDMQNDEVSFFFFSSKKKKNCAGVLFECSSRCLCKGSFESALDENDETEWSRFFPGQDLNPNHSAHPLVAAFSAFLDEVECRRKDGALLVPFSEMQRVLPESFLEVLSNDPLLV